MAEKSRDEITQVINNNIYDNTNKEVTAALVRQVFNEFKESFFNIVDDKLKDLQYDDTTTLANKISGSFEPPYWGTSFWFDLGSADGDTEDYEGNTGIVTECLYNYLGDSDVDIRLTLSPNIPDINTLKIIITVHYDGDVNNNNDVGVPVIRRISPTQLSVGLREVTSHTQKLRLEVFAFAVQIPGNNG